MFPEILAFFCKYLPDFVPKYLEKCFKCLKNYRCFKQNSYFLAMQEYRTSYFSTGMHFFIHEANH